MDNTNHSYDPEILVALDADWKKNGWRSCTPAEQRARDLHWKYCPDGTEHTFRVVSEESYMCDTMYKCIKCGHKMRQDSGEIHE